MNCSHEPAAARADRQPDGDLTMPCAGARQQQRGHVRTRDQQHEADGHREDAQRLREPVAQACQPPTAVGDVQLADMTRHAIEQGGIRLQPIEKQRQCGFGLLAGDAGLQSADHLQPADSRVAEQ